jgi:hypothetical protein
MSDLKIHEFRERAERGLDVPDFADIGRRGQALRHRRLAASVGALAVVLVAGAGIARIATDDTDAAPGPAKPPSPTPSSTWDEGVRTAAKLGEDVLRRGPAEVSYGPGTVRFDAPGPNWEWWDDGMGLRRTTEDASHYGAAIFFLQDPRVRLQQCTRPRVKALGSDPDRLVANVAPLLDVAHTTVLQGPRVVDAFGGTAVHLRLQTDGACPESGDRPLQLGGVNNGSVVNPAWPGRRVLDVWHVVARGASPASILVASWDLNGTSKHHAQQAALLDSVRIDFQ